MLVMNILQCIAYITGFILVFKEGALNKTLFFVLAVIINIMLGLIPLFMVAHWLIFVEYTLHQSRDIINCFNNFLRS